jgi:hypothetical protein
MLSLPFYVGQALAAAEGAKVAGRDPSEAAGIVLLVLFYLLWRWKKKKNAARKSGMEVKKGKPAAFSTKNCPECGERIPLAAVRCEHCGKKQKADDSTCSGGVVTAAEGRSDFAESRRKVKGIKSPGYIWRTAQDGAVCERCANNNGHKFSWDEEPPGGHAGAKARCRCYPEPIL